LLNVVLALDLPDNEITAQMTGEVRADNTRDLLVLLLQKAAQEAPLLLALEDAHWFDSASWSVVRVVSQQVQPLLLLATTRPFDGAPPPEFTQLLNDPAVVYFKLTALSHGSTLALVCQRLGVASLPQPVADFIYEKAEGHPFFSEELAYALRDAGVIEVSNGVCRIAPHIGDLHALNFPYTIQGVIISRVDRLTPQQQLTLKVASVIGRIFAYYTLRDVYPVEADKPRLPEHLQMLEKLDLTTLASAEPDLAYLFKHIITQEVVYNLMLFAQRKQLHQAVAEWYEQQHADDLSPFYPLLVHHWSKAENYSKTLDYLEKAGEQALRDYANQEAVTFFEQALELVAQAEAPKAADRVRQARWERQLGEAHYGLGHMVEGRTHLVRSLSRLGYPVPEGLGQQIWRLGWQVLSQIAHRCFPRLYLGSGRYPELRMEAARSYSQLAEVYYLSNDTLQLLNATLYTLNLSERVEASPELARAYAQMSNVVSLIPMQGLARLYERRTWEALRQIHRPYEEAYVSMVFALLYSGVGDWERVERYISSALQFFRQIGDHERISESTTILATALGIAGQTQRSNQLFEQVLAEAQQIGNDLQRAWGMVGRAEDLLRQGMASQSEGLLLQALELLSASPDLSEQVRAYGLLAQAYLHQGKYYQSMQAAQDLLKVPGQSLPTLFSTLVGYAGVAEVYLTLWEGLLTAQPDILAALEKAERSEIARAARQACKAMHSFARVFSIGAPRAWLYQGWLERLDGRLRRAQRAWQRSLEAATALHMTYDMGRAYFEIGRILAITDSKREFHLQEAIRNFENCAALHELTKVRKEVGENVV
jgi:tetratricopeptide (TPR) repeat protein